MADPDPTATPGTVVGAIAAGAVVVPFLLVYAFLFLLRGLFVQVELPDITSTRSGEALTGLVVVIFLGLVLWGMARFADGRDRWVFTAGQVLTLAVSVDFVLDSSSGEPEVPAIVGIASLLALALVLLPPSARWVGTGGGRRLPKAARTVESEQSAAEGEARHRRAVDELLHGQH